MNIRKIAVSLFFLILTLGGIFSCSQYGVPCDELWEQRTLQENMYEYACLFGDEQAAQWYESRGLTRISQSTERDHGQSAYYPLAPLLAVFANEPAVINTVWHVYTWLWFMAGVIALYGLCRATGLTRPVSCMGSLLLYLCPRFFAEGHYNNKDMVLLSLVLLCLWMGALFLQKPGFGRGLLLSLFGAMAANAKIVGALPWGLMGLCAVILVTARRQWNKRMVGVSLTTIFAFLGIYFLITPACWTDPAGYAAYLLQYTSTFNRWTGVVLFRGMVFDQMEQRLPRYYLLWMMVVTLPVYVLPLAAGGQLYALLRLIRQKMEALRDPITLALGALSVCWALPLGLAVLMQPTVYNGWRHFYFVYAGLAGLGAHAIGAIMRYARAKSGDYVMHRVFALGMCLVFSWMAVGIAANHPYQYGYYNRLGRETAEQDMELDYWYVSTVNAMKALIGHERDERLPLVLGARDDMSWLGIGQGHPTLSPAEQAALSIEENRDAPYLLFNTTYARIYGEKPPEGYHALFTLRSYGLTLCTVYEKDL